MERTPWTSGTNRLNRLLLLLPGTFSIQHRDPTTISAALAMASKTTWSHLALGPLLLLFWSTDDDDTPPDGTDDIGTALLGEASGP